MGKSLGVLDVSDDVTASVWSAWDAGGVTCMTLSPRQSSVPMHSSVEGFHILTVMSKEPVTLEKFEGSDL